MTGEQRRVAGLHFFAANPFQVHRRSASKALFAGGFSGETDSPRFLSVLSLSAVDTQNGRPYNPPALNDVALRPPRQRFQDRAEVLPGNRKNRPVPKN
jgi:hypothetical protein